MPALKCLVKNLSVKVFARQQSVSLMLVIFRNRMILCRLNRICTLGQHSRRMGYII
ncbi:MAG: hypothetical protein KF862_06970 [Chitinophagaceae bacterium]|nr:hypothetical protein [Chitinophagaceae bacterium]